MKTKISDKEFEKQLIAFGKKLMEDYNNLAKKIDTREKMAKYLETNLDLASLLLASFYATTEKNGWNVTMTELLGQIEKSIFRIIYKQKAETAIYQKFDKKKEKK